MENRIPVMYPQNERTEENPSDWAYLLWTDIMVYPIVENDTQVLVKFPSGNNWIDWWDSSVIYTGGVNQTLEYPIELFPVFIRQGAMLALDVSKDLGLRHGDEYSANYLTVFIPYAMEEGSQVVRRWGSPSQELFYSFSSPTKQFHFYATAHERSLLIVLHNVMEEPSRINNVVPGGHAVDRVALKSDFQRIASNCWIYFPEDKTLWIKPARSEEGTHISVENLLLR